MKKLIILLLFSGLAFATFKGVQFYRLNLTGVLTAVKKPSIDLSKVLPASPQEAKNTTGLPLKLPPGFSISIYSQDLGGPRDIEDGFNQSLLVSLTSKGKVVALPDKNRDGVADQIITVIDQLNQPHGLHSQCTPAGCFLFVAETNAVWEYRYDPYLFKVGTRKKITDLPSGSGHFTRSLAGAPGVLYISIGSSCNVCDESDPRRASILEYEPTTGTTTTLATGLRNSVFMLHDPRDGRIWATDMGRDLLGDNLPPDEINIIEKGKDYGWPHCYGQQITDPFNTGQKDCSTTEPSRIDLPAHSAPLGLDIILPSSKYWPRDFWDNLLVAYHGSWNRSVPTGYKVVRLQFDDQGKYLGQEDFITGWLTSKNEVLGRPVDIFVDTNIIYISDDKAGVIYRVEYTGI